MARKQRHYVSDDSEEDSDSVSKTAQTQTNNIKTRNTARKGTTPVLTRRKKRLRLQDTSDSDTSPQPSTSGIANCQNDSTEDSGSRESSDSESADSDYGPVKDKTIRKKKMPSPVKRGRQAKDTGNKKLKKQNNSVNVSSQKRSRNSDHLNKSNKSNSKASQSANDISLDPKQVERLAQKLVYFLLIEDQRKYAIKRKAIITHVFKEEAHSSKLFNQVMIKANSILKKVYGMELFELENQKDSYLLVNILPRELGVHDSIEMPKLKQQQHGLILYLITVIFMNENVISEDELIQCLAPLGIDLTSKKLHPIFGDVKKYISSELVKQMYLHYECISKDPPKYEISWGLRAKQEFDKTDLLRYACQVMGDTEPRDWKIQFKDAEKSANPRTNDD